MVKRYGTSSMECENGIYVLHKDYEALEVEVRALREDAERLAWWFRFDPPKDNDFVNVYLKGISERWNLDRWRDAIDAERGAK